MMDSNADSLHLRLRIEARSTFCVGLKTEPGLMLDLSASMSSPHADKPGS